MNIAVVGYGRMGKEIAQIAPQYNTNIVSIIDPIAPEAQYKQIVPEAVEAADVVLEFTSPSA
ncbi:MAG: 4-hydroxy-tetrahydrodipicolinate reductase, partial [Planctomycetota bacterium]